MEKIILLGCGGHAKSVVDSIEVSGVYEIVGFVDNVKDKSNVYKEYKLIGSDECLEEIYHSGVTNAFITIGFMGNSDTRNRLYNKLQRIGFHIPNIIDNTAIIAQDARFGKGNYIGKGTVINANAYLEDLCIINTKAIVEHDCVIKSNVHVAVGATLCGGVYIEHDTLIGANSVVIQEIKVGKNVIVGAGSVVTRNIESNIKLMQKKEEVKILI